MVEEAGEGLRIVSSAQRRVVVYMGHRCVCRPINFFLLDEAGPNGMPPPQSPLITRITVFNYGGGGSVVGGVGGY